MSHGYVISLDPSEISARFADPHSWEDFDISEEEAREIVEDATPLFTTETFEEIISPLLDKIPPREADFIYLYYVLKKRQADIALIFEVTQAAVSYSLGRGIQRLKFLLELPDISEEELQLLLEEIFDGTDVSILMGIWTTTCQTVVAEQLGLTQGKVRHRFFRAVKKLKEEASKEIRYKPAEKVFSLISDKKYKFNILRRVNLPQWANRGQDQIT